jgi:serine phosphatase RsbU (regulator of sigma subunit)/integral membrane sensor domain MASE1
MAEAAERKLLARSPAVRLLALFVLIAVTYALGAELSWQSFSSGMAFGFPPAGITVAAMLLTSRRYWPAVIAAIVVSEVGVDLQHGLTLSLALASAAANVVEPVVGASLVRRWCGGVPDLTTRGDLVRFLGGAVVAGPIAGGLVAATATVVSSGGWWPGLVLQWWAGDGIAVLVIGGPILLWARRRELVSSRWPELTLLVAVTAGLSIVAFRYGAPSSLLFLPLVAWAAFRLSDLGVVLAGTAFAAVANYMTAAGYGGLAHLGLSAPNSLVVTQVYTAVIVLIGWVLAQEVAGRMIAVQDRDSAGLQRELADARRMAAELGVALADAGTMRQVAERVSAAVHGQVGAGYSAVSTLDADGRGFALLGGEGTAPQLAVSALQQTIDSDAPGPQAVRDRAPVYLTDRAAPALDTPGAPPGGDAASGPPCVALPLLTEAGPLGYLGVWWPGPHEATPVEREYLRAIAETASRALERARLRQAEQRERARVETLSEVTRLLAGALSPEAIGDIVADRVRTAVGRADALSLGLVSQDRRRLEWITVAGYPEEIQDQFTGLLLSTPAAATDTARTGRPAVIRTRGEYAQRYPGPSGAAAAAAGASWLVWPLQAGPTSIGVLGLMWKRPQQFEPGQLAFTAAVADLIAQALVRAQKFADEHAIATVLQRAVMPRMTAVLPGMDVGTHYRQAGATEAIGGDWYDAVALPTGGAYLAVGDVVGHGIAAAEDMTQLRNAGRALAITGHQPASLLAQLGQITAVATAGRFATMAAAIIDRDGSIITYASAGHPPVLIRRAKTGTVETPLPARGPALGMMDHITYPQHQTSFEPGDVMLMYTDGLIERRGEDPEDGISRVEQQLLAWQPGTPLDDFCTQLIDTLAASPQLDDMCVLAVGRRS